MYSIMQISILADSFCLLISIVLLVLLLIGEDSRSKLNRLFMRIVVCNIGLFSLDLISWLFAGNTATYSLIITRVTVFACYCLTYLVIPLYTDYISALISRNAKITKAISRVMYTIFVVCIVFLVISQFNDMFYYFDQDNIYRAGEYFWLGQVIGLSSVGLATAFVYRHRRSMQMREHILLHTFFIFPTVAVFVQMFFLQDIELLFIATVISGVAIYGGIQSQQAKQQKERELDLHIQIMLSQIQPHFLYNSLSAISDLCFDNAQAQEALHTFAEYLRTNMKSITQKEPVPFETELHHTKQYLWMEQLRFEKKLKVDYDIQATDFSIPVLTIQPIVENAVYHGLFERGTGGTVTIQTVEKDDCFRITVTDDGVGFDPNNIQKDGHAGPGAHSHTGIKNVRSRLASLCGGTLVIQSSPGNGTTATIEIPKEVKQQEV